MHYFKLSLKKQSYPRHIGFLEDFLVLFQKSNPKALLEEYYEHDPNGIIHFHALVTSNRNIYVNNIRQLLPDPASYNFNFKKIADDDELRNWSKYIKKDQYKETRIINQEHELQRIHNAFFIKCPECFEESNTESQSEGVPLAESSSESRPRAKASPAMKTEFSSERTTAGVRRPKRTVIVHFS